LISEIKDGRSVGHREGVALSSLDTSMGSFGIQP
jgi:hypothetical protein